MFEKKPSEIPSVMILKSIRPENAGTGEEELKYGEHGERLARAVVEYRLASAARFGAFLETEDDSLQEESRARQVAMENLIKTAYKLVNAPDENHDVWADRFTQGSIELYGEPDKQEAARLLSDEFDAVYQLQGKEGVSQQHVQLLLDTYGPMLAEYGQQTLDSSEVEKEKQAIHEYGQAIIGKYRPLFEAVEDSGKEEFNAEELRHLFNSSIDWLKENDDTGWDGWQAIDSGGTMLSVVAKQRIIKVPSGRGPASAEDVRGLLAHELLVHALRGKNGDKTNDDGLATGLPGYLDAEEGLGILAEEAVNGELPEKAYDRYVDIALALGSIDGRQRTRQEIFDISFARQLVRQQAKGEVSESDIADLERTVWVHVDRMYRGGRGDDTGEREAIFTKDIAYYVGYKKMAGYVSGQIASGKTADEVFEYLSQGKFDPTNPRHIERLNKVQ